MGPWRRPPLWTLFKRIYIRYPPDKGSSISWRCRVAIPLYRGTKLKVKVKEMKTKEHSDSDVYKNV